MDTLSALEAVGTDNKDRPVQDLVIEKAAVFVDPFTEAEEELAKQRQDEIDKNLPSKAEKKPAKEEKKVYGSGVGKYINPTIKKDARKAEEDGGSKKKQKTAGYAFGNFSSW